MFWCENLASTEILQYIGTGASGKIHGGCSIVQGENTICSVDNTAEGLEDIVKNSQADQVPRDETHQVRLPVLILYTLQMQVKNI